MLEIDTSKKNAFLFDFDGTMVDTEHLHYEAYKGALSSIGIEYVSFDEHVKYNVGPASEEVLRKELRKNGRTEIGLDELVVMKKYIFSQKLNNQGVKAVDGLIDFIYQLKPRGLKLVIVSGGKYEAVIRVMMIAGIPNVFDLIVSREAVQKQKPDPEGYLKAMQMLNLKPEQCMAFESDQTGLEATSRAGIDSIAVLLYPDGNEIKDRYSNVTIVNNFKEIAVK